MSESLSEIVDKFKDLNDLEFEEMFIEDIC